MAGRRQPGLKASTLKEKHHEATGIWWDKKGMEDDCFKVQETGRERQAVLARSGRAARPKKQNFHSAGNSMILTFVYDLNRDEKPRGWKPLHKTERLETFPVQKQSKTSPQRSHNRPLEFTVGPASQGHRQVRRAQPLFGAGTGNE